MRFILILMLCIMVCYPVSGGNFTILDAAGGLWNVQQIFSRMLSGGQRPADGNLELAFKTVEKLPEKLRQDQAAVIAGLVGKRLQADQVYVPIKPAAVVVVAGNDCPIDDITVDDLRRIYSGRAASWSRFGGEDIPIRRAGYSIDAVCGKVFHYKVMAASAGETSSDPARIIAPGMAVCRTDSAVAALVRAVPGMIAFGAQGLAGGQYGQYKVLKINGVLPDADSIADGRYPLAIPLGIVFSKNVSAEQVRKIVGFVQGNTSATQSKSRLERKSDKKINN